MANLLKTELEAKTFVDQGRLWRAVKPSKPGPSTVASDTYAALTREQWADYVKNYVPIENKLIQYATDPAQPGLAMQKASDNVSAAFGSAQGGTQRELAGLGVQLSGAEQAAQDKSYGLSKSLADVQAQNLAGSATRARQQGVMGIQAPDVTSQAAQSGV